MANLSAQQPSVGALPTFSAEPIQETGKTAYPVAEDKAGPIWAQALGNLSAHLGAWAQASFRQEAEEAGRIAGLNPDYRPDQAPIIQGAAFQKAALSTYQNQLEAKTRNAANTAYTDYMNRPASERDPAQFAKDLEAKRQDLLKHDVFPEVQPAFEQGWSALERTYKGGAQDDFDKRTLDAAKAATLTNLQSTGDTAHRVASIPGPEGDKQVPAQLAAYGKLVDAAIDQGQFSATQGAQLKIQFEQGLRQTRALTVFSAVPKEQQRAFLEQFQREYGAGVGKGALNIVYHGALDQAARGAPSPKALYDYLVGKGASKNEAQLLTGAAASESGLNPTASHDGGIGSGLFGHNGDRLAALRAKYGASPSWQDQASFALAELRARPESALVNAAKSPEDLAVAQMHFEQPEGYTKATPQAGHNYTGRLNTLRRFSALAGGPELAPVDNRTAGLSHDSFVYLSAKMEQQVRSVEAEAATAERTALADIAAAKKQIAGGDDVTPAAWSQLSQQYGASTNPDVRAAFDQASAVRSTLAGFAGQKPEVVEAKIATMQASLEHGASPQQVEIVKDAQAWLGRYREDLANNPVGRYAKDYGVAVPPLDLASPQALATSLTARAPLAEQAAAVYGLPGARYLMPEDKAAFKTLAANGGPQMVQAAGAIMGAMGARGADVLREIGGDAPAFVTAARVSAWGGDPSFLADFAEWQRLANDPATRKGMELPNRKVADQVFNETLGHALLALPDLNAGARTAGVQAFEVRALRNGYDKSLNDSAATAELAKTAQQALGATYVGAAQYGGVGSRSLGFLRGEEQLLVPGAMRADKIGDALASLTDDDLKALPAPPLYADNRPATARAVAGSRLVSVGRGKYRVASGDPLAADTTYLKTADGGPFVLDLNALEDRLRARVPGLYK